MNVYKGYIKEGPLAGHSKCHVGKHFVVVELWLGGVQMHHYCYRNGIWHWKGAERIFKNGIITPHPGEQLWWSRQT